VRALSITRFLDAPPAGLSVLNDRPTEGGSEEEFAEVHENDFARLRAELLAQARDKGWTRLATVGGADLNLISDSLRTEVETELYSTGLRVAAEALTGRMTVRLSVLGYSRPALHRLAEAAWAISVPQGWRPVGSAPELGVVEYLGYDGTIAQYRIGVRGPIVRDVDGTQLAARLRGASLMEARGAIDDQHDLGADVRIEMWPDWAPRAYRLRVSGAGTE
jgi:hypothetical protein